MISGDTIKCTISPRANIYHISVSCNTWNFIFVSGRFNLDSTDILYVNMLINYKCSDSYHEPALLLGAKGGLRSLTGILFEGVVNRIYPPELQLNKANTSDTEAPFLDLHLSISNGFVSSKVYDKRDDFDFDIVNFPFLDGDVPRSTSYGVYISQLIRFARVSSHVVDFNGRNKKFNCQTSPTGLSVS